MLRVFLNGIFSKYGKHYFYLKGLNFSHCLSMCCDQRDNHGISSRLFLVCIPMGLLPQALFLQPPAKPGEPFWMYSWLGGVFLCSPVPTSHHSWDVFLPVVKKVQGKDKHGIYQASFSDFTQPHSSIAQAQPLFLNFFITRQISKTFQLTQCIVRRTLFTLKFPLHTWWHMSPWFLMWLKNHYIRFVLSLN